VCTVLAREDDASLALDLGDRAIAKLHRAGDVRVELDEDFLRTRHVVHSIGVEDPPIMVVPLHRAQICVDPLLINVAGTTLELNCNMG
jgi:hypothetical protein